VAWVSEICEQARFEVRPASGERSHGLATQRLFAETIAATECRLEGDLLHEAEGPGLGVTIDEDSLQAHRL